MLLPHPDSPTRASVRPRAIAKPTSSTACTNWRGLRSATRLSQGGETSKVLASPTTSTSGAAHAAARIGGACSQHAARVDPAAISSGRSVVQGSNACGQRGLNAQPGGIAFRRGIAPSIWSRRAPVLVHRRDRSHQADRVGVRGRMDHGIDRSDLDDPARVHHRDAVAGLGDHAHVVGDEHDRGAVLLAEALQQRNDLRLDRDVERGGRLVGDDQARLAGKRQGDDDALAHAAGELVRILVETLLGRGDAGLLEQPDGAPPRLGRAERQVRLDRLDRAAGRRCRADRARSADPGRSRRCGGRGSCASARTAGRRCARRRSGSRRRRSARADRAGR